MAKAANHKQGTRRKRKARLPEGRPPVWPRFEDDPARYVESEYDHIARFEREPGGRLWTPPDDLYPTIETPPPASPTAKEGWQIRRVKVAFKELFPPDGCPPEDMLQKTVHADVKAFFKARGQKSVSLDSVARAMGRRRT